MSEEGLDPAAPLAMPADGARGPGEGPPPSFGPGSQYASPPIGKTVGESGIAPSMGPASSPRGSAAAESPTGAVKAERVHARAFSGREEAALGMIEHIECLCNGIGIRSALGRLSPEEFEKKQMEESRPKAA